MRAVGFNFCKSEARISAEHCADHLVKNLKEQRPDITAKEIFKSGINIGRDMIGTMSNTLILAYAGGSLGLVMIIYAYSYQMHQILNMYSLAIEIMRGIAGTIGIILTVPITSLIMSVLLTRGGQKISTDKCK